MFVLSAICPAADIYITQNTSGGDTGANCSNAHSASWFNSNQAAGNTYHMCGTFTGAAGATILSVSAGSAGNIKTILFESGAVMTAPVWGSGSGTYPTGGAINVNGSYVTVDGGTNGRITATLSGASGTTCPGGACTYDRTTAGIVVSSAASNVEIKNLTINNIYLCNNASACNTSWYTAGIMFGPYASNSNVSIHDNTVSGVGTEIFYEFSGHAISNVNIFNNALGTDGHGGYWGIAVAAGSAGNSTSNVNIYKNTIQGCADWNGQYNNGGPANGYHCDAAMLYCTQASTCPFTLYGNLISFTGAVTADIYCTYSSGSGGSGSQCTMFNNVLYIDNNTGSGVGGGAAFWAGGSTGPHYLYNNTIVGTATTPSNYLVMLGEGTVQDLRNNIVVTDHYGVYNYSGSLSSYLKAGDYNLYYNVASSPFFNGSSAITYSAWQNLGYDAHGVTNNPNLDSNYKLQAGSAAIGKATNLTSQCTGNLAALCLDNAGVTRPPSGAWDVGAYQYSSSGEAPPQGLVANVH
jgi:hypothetical protein